MNDAEGSKKIETTEEKKQKVIELFNKKVRGRIPDTSGYDADHCGSGGHWLEKQMGVVHNANNLPDLLGFEMKNETSSKTSFGDWSASYYIFRDRSYGIDRDRFMQIFGKPNPKKRNRYSWSGSPIPKIGSYNEFGQILKIDKAGNLFAIYSFQEDRRPGKEKIVPYNMQKGDLVIARWDVELMKKNVEQKFNKLGWFKCKKNIRGAYSGIVFGAPIDYEAWIEGVRKGLIFFDSGMYHPLPVDSFDRGWKT